MLTIAPFESFSRDAEVLERLGDESPLPMRWLAAAQVASNLADGHVKHRSEVLNNWLKGDSEPDGIWAALAVPGIPVRDLPSGVSALCAIAAEMEEAGAFNMAYATATNARIAVLDGPVLERGFATAQAARILHKLGHPMEAGETCGVARDDAEQTGDPKLAALVREVEELIAGR